MDLIKFRIHFRVKPDAGSNLRNLEGQSGKTWQESDRDPGS